MRAESQDTRKCPLMGAVWRRVCEHRSLPDLAGFGKIWRDWAGFLQGAVMILYFWMGMQRYGVDGRPEWGGHQRSPSSCACWDCESLPTAPRPQYTSRLGGWRVAGEVSG